MGGEGDCAAGDSPTSWLVDFRPHPAVAKISRQSEHPKVSGECLIEGYAHIVWNTERSRIKPTKLSVMRTERPATVPRQIREARDI
jgi:hypothetical protein